jgi:hypothetical protein
MKIADFNFKALCWGINTWCIFLLFCFGEGVSAQAVFNYKQVPVSYLPSITDLAPYKATENVLKKSAYNITRSLPAGYVKDGSEDYTTYLQTAINNNVTVLMPNFPVLINSDGLSILSNRVVLFGANSKLIMKPNSLSNYQILRIFDANNVKIFFPVVVGDRNSHIGNSGEWGMGISIASSSNVQIINPKVSNCWGDGIYIGKINEKNNRGINIYYPQVDNNRRNGISVASATNVLIKHPLVSNSNGTEPMAAIDLEPNENNDDLNNITIDKPITFNSKRGVMIVLLGLLGKKSHEVNININNHVDDQSQTALHYSGYQALYNGNPIGGVIRINNSTWKNNLNGFGHGSNNKYGPMLHINKITTKNKSTSYRPQREVIDLIKRELTDTDKIKLTN